MKVTFSHNLPPYWEITDGQKWWSVSRAERGGFFIMDGLGRPLDPNGPTGRKLIETINGYELGYQDV